MAVEIFDPFRNFLAANQQLGVGLGSLGQARRQRTQLDLSAQQLEESKLSGISNRAQQEALTDQASATAESTRIKNKVLRSLPKDVLQGIYTKEAAHQKSQIFAQQAQINTMVKLNALDKARATQSAEISQAQSQAEIQSVKAASAQVMQAFDEQNKKLTIEKQQRDQRLSDFNDVVKGMDVAGTNAAREAFMAGKPINEIGEIGLAADQETSATLAATERESRIAETKAKARPESPRAQKKEDETFGNDTLERRQNAEANAQPVQPVVILKFDKTPGGSFTKIFDKDTPFKVDYTEAVKIGKDKEWLKGYEETFGEPFDIPGSEPEDKETPQPPASVIKVRDAKYPGKEIVFRDGKWGIVQ